MTRKAIFYILFVFAMVFVVGCDSRSSDVERNGVSKPAQSTKSETSIRNSNKEVTLPGSSKVEPTQVQIRLPKILGQGSAEIKEIERRLSALEKRLDKLDQAWNGCLKLNLDAYCKTYP